jgi:hypothetical protein
MGAPPAQVAPVGLTVQWSTTTALTVIWPVLIKPELAEALGRPGGGAAARTAIEASIANRVSSRRQKINVTYIVSK